MPSRPFLLFTTVIVALLVAMSESTSHDRLSPHHITYSTVTGYFLQDENATDASTFDYTTTNFGLINRTYAADSPKTAHATQWQRFAAEVARLNAESPHNVQYKLLIMGRHGEGTHNVAETFYGTPAWNCYWSEQDGNGTVIWADAELTEAGIAQAQVANDFWASEIAVQKIPRPESYYTSPLRRCLHTAQVTFDGLDLQGAAPFVPVVKELFREAIGVHTCDRRSSKTWIAENYPTYKFEEGFAEDDPLWDPITRETNSAQDVRSRTVLDDVFSHDRNTYISITSHSGEIGSILRVLGHRTFSLNTGAVIPVLAKAELVRGPEPATSTEAWTTVSTCSTVPATTTSSVTTTTAT